MQTDQAQVRGRPGMSERADVKDLTVAAVLGEIVWLMTQSPTHKHHALTDLEWLVMPPLVLKQCRLFHGDDGRPAAAAFWAFLSSDSEHRMTDSGLRLRPDEWNAKNGTPWLIDLVAPFDNSDGAMAQKIIADLSRSAFSGRFFRTLYVDPKTGKRKVLEIGKETPACPREEKEGPAS